MISSNSRLNVFAQRYLDRIWQRYDAFDKSNALIQQLTTNERKLQRGLNKMDQLIAQLNACINQFSQQEAAIQAQLDGLQANFVAAMNAILNPPAPVAAPQPEPVPAPEPAPQA